MAAPPNPTTPLRTQYPFSASAYKFKTGAELLKLQRQWDTFERIENFNDLVYQRMTAGYYDKPYYLYTGRDEMVDFVSGQRLHIERFPDAAAAGEFIAISDRPKPTTPPISLPVQVDPQPPRGVPYSTIRSASDQARITNDLNTYIYVSTFNATHVYKHTFAGDEERFAYCRAERRVLFGDDV